MDVELTVSDLSAGYGSHMVVDGLSLPTLRGGQVQEIGTPAELAASGGIYAQLLELQRAGTQEARKMLKEYGLSG